VPARQSVAHRAPALIALLLLIAVVVAPAVHAAPRLRLTRPVDVWPTAARNGPFLLGAVEAFRAPHRADEIGVRWQRVLFDWTVIQPDGPDDWKLSWIDEDLLDAERAAGRPVVGLLIGTPGWASGVRAVTAPPRGLDLPLDDPRNVWATWVRTVTGRFAGRVDAWVIWNEPDVWSGASGDRQWSGTPGEYYRLLKAAYLSAKSVDPGARILMAGLTYWWDEEYGREQYFRRILQEAAADPSAPAHGWYFDGAVLQLYNNPRALLEVPARFREMMRPYGLEKPIWVNEANVVPWDDPSSPLPRTDYRATLDEQSSYLVQATAYALAAGVERLAVYKLRDDDDLDRKPVPRAYGLVRNDSDHTLRPIARTFKVLADELAPTSRAQLVDDGPIRRVYLEQPSRARRLTIVWNMDAESIDVELPALGSRAQAMDKLGRLWPLAIDEDGWLRVAARGATANTLPGFPDGYFIGGEPVIVVEPLPPSYQPYAPTTEDDDVVAQAWTTR
jgi:hypothetical protein